VQQSNSKLGPAYTITYAVAAPNHDPGTIGKEQLLSRFASDIDELSAGNCVHPPPTPQTADIDQIVCPIGGRTRFRGLLFASWDRGDPVPVDFDAPFAATKRAASDIFAIWFNR
jgi:hypothetical protein